MYLTFCAESQPIADKHNRRNRKEKPIMAIIPTPSCEGEGGDTVLKKRHLAPFMIAHDLSGVGCF
jgi:hypothetical protein